MRIISQDSKKDFPYEMCTIWTFENKIFASPIGEPNTEAVMAEYSTPEKSEKAMQLLHEAYTGAPLIIKNIEVPEDFVEQLKDLRSEIITVHDREDNVRIEQMNIVFRFPSEDDI